MRHDPSVLVSEALMFTSSSNCAISLLVIHCSERMMTFLDIGALEPAESIVESISLQVSCVTAYIVVRCEHIHMNLDRK